MAPGALTLMRYTRSVKRPNKVYIAGRNKPKKQRCNIYTIRTYI